MIHGQNLAQPQVNLSLLHSNCLKFQPQDGSFKLRSNVSKILYIHTGEGG
jgi:hypothetical protein